MTYLCTTVIQILVCNGEVFFSVDTCFFSLFYVVAQGDGFQPIANETTFAADINTVYRL